MDGGCCRFRPTIALPEQAEWSEQELYYVLCHELTHWRRNDILYKWFSVIVQSVHWFNPVSYLIRRTLDNYCELSCDEAVIRDLDQQSRIAYGSTLLNLASTHALPGNMLATTLSEGKRRLKERIDGIRNFKKCSAGSAFLMAAIALLLTGCASVIPQTEQPVMTVASTSQIADGSGADTSETPQNSQNDAPTEQDVLAMRRAVEAGMTKEEIAWLTEVIKQANLWWEQRYMWEDIFGWNSLGDPENLAWNYFDQTGEIQIGWAEGPDADTDGAHIEMYHMLDRKSTRLNSSHPTTSRMPSSA